MHRTQLLRLYDRLETGERALLASRNNQHANQENGHANPTENGGDKESAVTPTMTLRKYWLIKNMKSLDGLPGLLTAPDAALEMIPQSNFDKDSARPMLRHVKGDDKTTQVRSWFASGFVLGAVTVFAVTRLVERLKG